MGPSDRLYQFLISQLSDAEISLIMQSPDNIPIVIAGRVMHTIETNGKNAIHGIRHKGQKILGRTNRIGGTKAIFFDFKSREKSRRNQN